MTTNKIPRTDEDFMRLPIEEAERGIHAPGPGEVGCVIVKEGAIVASGHNEARLRRDPTGHAEIVTMRRVDQFLQAI